jgi:hypothetical protein
MQAHTAITAELCDLSDCEHRGIYYYQSAYAPDEPIDALLQVARDADAPAWQIHTPFGAIEQYRLVFHPDSPDKPLGEFAPITEDEWLRLHEIAWRRHIDKFHKLVT